jgi:hypothetical protein
MTLARLAVILAIATVSLSAFAPAAEPAAVETLRISGNGVQPQVVVDTAKNVHVIYLAGDPNAADIFYIHSADGGLSFSKPVRVNSQPHSAMAIGTVRGAQLALGKNGRLHVAWMGSNLAEPKAPGKATPMLYARLADNGLSFDPQRNVIQSHPGLDGGGSIAADEHGNVYIAWHAPLEKGAGEQSRQVWLTQSQDDGQTFSAEKPLSADTGACGCCGLRIACSGEKLYGLYRTADQKIERDMTLLRFDPKSASTTSAIVGKMQSGICVMSTSALAATRGGAVGAWETNGQIFWSNFPSQGVPPAGLAVPGRPAGRKHPALAVNSAGQTLVVWTEGTGWNKGGAVAWQEYDADGRIIPNARGRGEGLPAWGAPAAFARKDGKFVVMY